MPQVLCDPRHGQVKPVLRMSTTCAVWQLQCSAAGAGLLPWAGQGLASARISKVIQKQQISLNMMVTLTVHLTRFLFKDLSRFFGPYLSVQSLHSLKYQVTGKI